MKTIDREALLKELWVCAPSCELCDDESLTFRSGYDLAMRVAKNFFFEERYTRQEARGQTCQDILDQYMSRSYNSVQEANEWLIEEMIKGVNS